MNKSANFAQESHHSPSLRTGLNHKHNIHLPPRSTRHTIWAHDTRRARTSAALGRYRSTPMHWIDAFNVTLRMFDMRFWPDSHLIKWTSPSFGVTFPTLIGKLVNAALTWSLRLSKAYPLSGWRCESNRFLLKKNKADLVKPGRYKPLRCSRFNSVMKTLISPFSLQCW